MPSLSKLLERKRVLLSDGATGTNLFTMGLEPGMTPEIFNLTAPQKVIDLHRRFIDAGSDVILTNTFGANYYRLKFHSLEDKVYELNEKATELARRAAKPYDKEIAVVGSVGPTGELPAPLGTLTHQDMVAAFCDQIKGLQAGGVDAIVIETMSSLTEIAAASEAASTLKIDYCVTASFDTAGKTMMGLDPGNLLEAFADVTTKPLGYGANCGVGPADLVLAVTKMAAKDPGAILIAKANCGIPEATEAGICYSGTPELMAQYALLAADGGARIIGGCCGTTFDHIKAMRLALDTYEPGHSPTKEEIIAKLGEFKSPQIQTSGGKITRRSRKSRQGHNAKIRVTTPR